MKTTYLTAMLLGIFSASVSDAVLASNTVKIPTPEEQNKMQQELLKFSKPYGENNRQIDNLLKPMPGTYDRIKVLMTEINGKHSSNQSAGDAVTQFTNSLNEIKGAVAQINGLIKNQSELIENGEKQVGKLPVFEDLKGKLQTLRNDMAKKEKTNEEISLQLTKIMEKEKEIVAKLPKK